jgi:ribosomal protein S18 acetylase RimI-like enzyme
MQVTFRPIRLEDSEFLRELNRLVMKDYVTQTWGWDEVWQRQYFVRNFDKNIGKILVLDNVDIGFYRVTEDQNETFLVSILILPEFQKKGIGTNLIQDLIAAKTKPIRLQVLKVNPAQNLYKRLGFTQVSETETHLIMKHF